MKKLSNNQMKEMKKDELIELLKKYQEENKEEKKEDKALEDILEKEIKTKDIPRTNEKKLRDEYKSLQKYYKSGLDNLKDKEKIINQIIILDRNLYRRNTKRSNVRSLKRYPIEHLKKEMKDLFIKNNLKDDNFDIKQGL